MIYPVKLFLRDTFYQLKIARHVLLCYKSICKYTFALVHPQPDDSHRVCVMRGLTSKKPLKHIADVTEIKDVVEFDSCGHEIIRYHLLKIDASLYNLGAHLLDIGAKRLKMSAQNRNKHILEYFWSRQLDSK